MSASRQTDQSLKSPPDFAWVAAASWVPGCTYSPNPFPIPTQLPSFFFLISGTRPGSEMSANEFIYKTEVTSCGFVEGRLWSFKTCFLSPSGFSLFYSFPELVWHHVRDICELLELLFHKCQSMEHPSREFFIFFLLSYSLFLFLIISELDSLGTQPWECPSVAPPPEPQWLTDLRAY